MHGSWQSVYISCKINKSLSRKATTHRIETDSFKLIVIGWWIR